MKHPFEVLKPEYLQLLPIMTVRPECQRLVDEVAHRLVGFKPHYEPVTAADGVPALFIATSFEREASSNFHLNPAQGWPLTSTSKWRPYNGPFRTWFDAAVEAYRLNGLDKVGAANWTWPLVCFYGELFNGMGYRDFHSMHSPYLWGGTNIQSRGKYTSDGNFDPEHMDQQLGIIPVARRMLELDPSLALAEPYPASTIPIPPPVHSGIAGEDSGADLKFVQGALNRLGWQPPLRVDGSFGTKTRDAVHHFQQNFGLTDDGGYPGPQVVAALKDAVAAIEADATKVPA